MTRKTTAGRLPIGRVLQNATGPAVGRDGIIVGCGRRGRIYLATSMPSRTEADLNNMIDLLQEAITELQRRKQAMKDA